LSTARSSILIRALALPARANDQGIGDLIARLIGPVGGDAYKTWFLAAFGQSCGCSERQADLNAKYPLTVPTAVTLQT